MTKKAFDKIAEGLNEAIAIARGEAKPAKLFVPAELDVKAIRKRVSLSQDGFASAFGFTLAQIRDWEQGRSRPLHANRAYLMLIDQDPAGILNALASMRSSAAKRRVA